MPPMFFTAGFFIPKSLLKNRSGFIKGKLLRLGIPLIAGSVILAPLLKAMASYSDGQDGNFISLISSFFLHRNFSQFHFWFLGILMIFFLIAAIFYYSFMGKKSLEQGINQSKPSFALLTGLFITTAVLSFAINLFVKSYEWTRLYIIEFQTIKIPVYFCYFLLGIYAYKKRWFENGFKPNIFLWVPIYLISTIMIIIFVSNAQDTILWKLLYNSSSSLQTMAFFLVIIALSRKTMDRDILFFRKTSRSSFAVYIIHLNILFIIQYLTRNIMVPSFIKFLLQASLTVILSWITASLLIPNPRFKVST